MGVVRISSSRNFDEKNKLLNKGYDSEKIKYSVADAALQCRCYLSPEERRCIFEW